MFSAVDPEYHVSLHQFHAGGHSYMGGCPTTTTGFGGAGGVYPYHHHSFGSGAGVPGSPLPTTTIFHDFLNLLNF